MRRRGQGCGGGRQLERAWAVRTADTAAALTVMALAPPAAGLGPSAMIALLLRRLPLRRLRSASAAPSALCLRCARGQDWCGCAAARARLRVLLEASLSHQPRRCRRLRLPAAIRRQRPSISQSLVAPACQRCARGRRLPEPGPAGHLALAYPRGACCKRLIPGDSSCGCTTPTQRWMHAGLSMEAKGRNNQCNIASDQSMQASRV